MIQKIQAAVDDLIAKNIAITSYEPSAEESAKQNIFVPAGKKARMVSFEGFAGCGCGGTHVCKIGEIGKIVIRKIKTKNGITKISYEVM